MICENCGKATVDGSQFCMNCGHRIEKGRIQKSEHVEEIRIERKEDKIDFAEIMKNIWKNRYYLIIAVLVLAIAIRLYYFNTNTAIWWDEGEYLSMAKVFSGNSHSWWWEGRPMLMPLIWAAMYKLSIGNEFSFRIIGVIFSILGIFGIYLLAKEMFGRKVALLSALLYSFFWMDIFYAERFLVDVPSATMTIFTVYFFWKGYVKKDRVSMWVFGIFAGLSILLRYTGGLILIAIFVYLLITSRLRFLKDRNLWIAFFIILAILSPYLLWSFVAFGNPVHPLIAGQGMINASPGLEKGMIDYFKLFPSHYLHIVLLLLFLVGLYRLVDVFIGLDIIWKQKKDSLNKYVFLMVWFMVTIFYFSFLTGHNEDRYLFPLMPIVFIFSAVGMFMIYRKVSRFNKNIAVMIVLALIGLVAYQQMSHTNDIMKAKGDSYQYVRQVGIWMNENTDEESKVLAQYWPMISYYSDREVLEFPKDADGMKKVIVDEGVDFIVLFTEYYKEDAWEFRYVKDENYDIAKIFYDGNGQAFAVIYGINKSG